MSASPQTRSSSAAAITAAQAGVAAATRGGAPHAGACGRVLVRGLLVAAVLLGPGAAGAEPLPDYAKDLLGEWLVATDDGRPGCRIRLEAGETIGGRVAKPSPECEARLPNVATVSAWTPSDGVRLYDPKRKLVLHFQEDETTFLKTRNGESPTTMLVQAKAGVDRAPHAPALFGTWTMRRPGGPSLCEVTFLDGPPPGGQESFGLRTSATCDAAVKRLKLTTWRIEDFDLMLYGEGDTSLRLSPSRSGFEKARSEGGRPLELVRQR